MTLLNGFYNLAVSFFTSALATKFLYPFFALFFIVTAPCIFHRIFRR